MISDKSTLFPLLDHEATQLSHNTICTMEGHKRRTSIDPESVESILAPGDSPPAAGAPSPHVGNSPSREQFAMAPPPRPMVTHSRTKSYTPRNANRLSLSFPIATARTSTDSPRPTPTSSNPPTCPPTPAESIPSPSLNDPTGFLNAIASQERRVLELKEELQKAEADLTKLKRQWAVHEAHKKRAEVRHVEQMQPLNPVSAESASSKEDAVTRQSAELDRRKALLNNMNNISTKETSTGSGRKVISGGHTRALSLLSPERSNFSPRPFPPLHEDRSENQPSLSRMTTMPDTSQGITRVGSRRARPLSYQGGLTHGAKQVAEDVKAGLWTFLEDLRQATVGEEAISGTVTRPSIENTSKAPMRKRSKTNLLANDKGRMTPPVSSTSPRTWDTLTGENTALSERSKSIWPKETSVKTPLPKKSRTLSLAAPALDDDWSDWDTPTPKSPRWSGSTTVAEDPATPSGKCVEDRALKVLKDSNSTATPARREDLQWPGLDKLTPKNLKKTVNTILQEWERTLSPDPEDRQNPLDIDKTIEEAEAILMSR